MAVVLGLVGGLLVAALLPVRVGPVPAPFPVARSESPGFDRPLFVHFTVPAPFAGSVSMAEPRWAGLARSDRSRAAEELERHLARLREAAPSALAARDEGEALPVFGMPMLAWDAEKRLRPLLLQYTHGREPAAKVLLNRVPQDSRGLAVLAALEIDTCDAGSSEGLRRAERLQQLLVAATGCRELPLVDDLELDPAERREANRHLGRLWLWLLNEIGHTERAWRTYQDLRGK